MPRALWMCALSVVLGMLLHGCSSPGVAPPAVQSPKIAFESSAHDFGTVEQGTNVMHTFAFRNSGGLELKLDNVRTACGCIAAASTTGSIAPGASGTVEVKLDTADASGPQSKTVTVYSNDPAQPVSTLTLSGVVRADAAADPPRLYVGHLGRGQTAVNEVRLSGAVTAAGRPRVSGESIDAVVSGTRLRIAIKDDAPLRAFTDTVRLATGSPRHPQLTIPITGFVDGNVVVSPAQVNFGTSIPGSSRVIGVRNRGKRPLHITAVRLTPAIGTAVVSPMAAGQGFRITVTLNAGLHAGKISGTLTVETDDPEQARIELPCSGRVVEKSS